MAPTASSGKVPVHPAARHGSGLQGGAPQTRSSAPRRSDGGGGGDVRRGERIMERELGRDLRRRRKQRSVPREAPPTLREASPLAGVTVPQQSQHCQEVWAVGHIPTYFVLCIYIVHTLVTGKMGKYLFKNAIQSAVSSHFATDRQDQVRGSSH